MKSFDIIDTKTIQYTLVEKFSDFSVSQSSSGMRSGKHMDHLFIVGRNDLEL